MPLSSRRPAGRHDIASLARSVAVTSLALAATAFVTPAAFAEVVAFDIVERRSEALGARTFGTWGAVESIRAKARIAVDPADPRNAVIADLDRAPRAAGGRVTATADVLILRPANGGSNVLLADIPNRGRKLMPILFDNTTAAGAAALDKADDAGIGFLLSRGYTLVWVGWQGDIERGKEGLVIDVPELEGVTGRSREEFVFDKTGSPMKAPLTYPAASMPGDGVLTVKAGPEDARQTPADLSFRFVDERTIEISRPAGFDAGAIYEFVYTAKDPKVLGLGFAATRDVVSFLRQARGDNPLGRPVSHAIAHGISQSGRYLRDFLYWGFNEDEKGRRVFDGMNPHIAGTRRTYTNVRFAQTSRNPSSHTDRLYPVDQFPFTYAVTDDPVSGRRDGLLLRCRLTNTCPKVIETASEVEFYGSRASLLVTDTRGYHLDLPEDVRAYFMSGVPHFKATVDKAGTMPACANTRNPLHGGALMRALLVALEGWVRDGTTPPTSRFPMHSDGTLVPFDEVYPPIPKLGYTGIHTPAQLIDFEQMPPKPVASYPVFAPRVDADGIAIDGVRLPSVAAPRATYTGWNPRAKGFGPGALCTNEGTALPFAATRAEREAAGDPRRSLEERYPTPDAYLRAVEAAAERLVAERLLLPEDGRRAVEEARADRLSQLH